MFVRHTCGNLNLGSVTAKLPGATVPAFVGNCAGFKAVL